MKIETGFFFLRKYLGTYLCFFFFKYSGSYDSTNVIDRPIAVGITLLDYDHVKVLGHTIEEIAWHKAGIMKKGTVAFINPNQPEVHKIKLPGVEELKTSIYRIKLRGLNRCFSVL